MAINIGSNYSFKAKRFLDDRQCSIQRKEDLKDWNMPVPEGFEIFVEGEWYIYKPVEEPDPITGYWFPRISQELGDSKTSIISQSVVTDKFKSIESDIFELSASIFPMTINITSGGGTYEVGQSVTPKITWKVTRKEVTLSPEKVTVNGGTSGISEDKLSYTGSAITSDTDYNIHIEYQKLVADKKVSYNFRYKKYWGVSSNTTLSNAEILGLNKSFSTSRTMGSTKFDCTGGKYVFYVLPKEQYSGLELWIGGLKNTDFTATDITLTNESGATHEYTMVRLENIQTGIIYIEFK